MRREAHASRDEYHIRVRLVTHNTEQHSTQGRCRQKTSFTMSREEINRARGRERERESPGRNVLFFFVPLPGAQRAFGGSRCRSWPRCTCQGSTAWVGKMEPNEGALSQLYNKVTLGLCLDTYLEQWTLDAFETGQPEPLCPS